jgi:hypothetical protein
MYAEMKYDLSRCHARIDPSLVCCPSHKLMPPPLYGSGSLSPNLPQAPLEIDQPDTPVSTSKSLSCLEGSQTLSFGVQMLQRFGNASNMEKAQFSPVIQATQHSYALLTWGSGP